MPLGHVLIGGSCPYAVNPYTETPVNAATVPKSRFCSYVYPCHSKVAGKSSSLMPKDSTFLVISSF